MYLVLWAMWEILLHTIPVITSFLFVFHLTVLQSWHVDWYDVHYSITWRNHLIPRVWYWWTLKLSIVRRFMYQLNTYIKHIPIYLYKTHGWFLKQQSFNSLYSQSQNADTHTHTHTHITKPPAAHSLRQTYSNCPTHSTHNALLS